jgi:hypothetical protein
MGMRCMGYGLCGNGLWVVWVMGVGVGVGVGVWVVWVGYGLWVVWVWVWVVGCMVVWVLGVECEMWNVVC